MTGDGFRGAREAVGGGRERSSLVGEEGRIRGLVVGWTGGRGNEEARGKRQWKGGGGYLVMKGRLEAWHQRR